MVKNPFLLKNIALVVVDELQEIGDPDRGPGLEITLTKIVSSPHRPQVIGLSAVLGNTDALARWLGADLLSFDKRPVELHEGVLYKGVFHYRTHNTLEKNSEPLAEIDFEDPTEVLLANVAHLAGKGDQVLVFLPSKLDTMFSPAFSQKGSTSPVPRAPLTSSLSWRKRPSRKNSHPAWGNRSPSIMQTCRGMNAASSRNTPEKGKSKSSSARRPWPWASIFPPRRSSCTRRNGRPTAATT